MKKNTYILIFLTLALVLQGCENILDKDPLDRYSDAVVFADVNLADKYLMSLYNKMGHGNSSVMMSAMSDEGANKRGGSTDTYHKGEQTADRTGGYNSTWTPNGTWDRFSVIQEINTFLANIDDVPNGYDDLQKPGVKAQTDVMKGEALFMRGFAYSQICRVYGGLPLFSKPNQFGDDFNAITRATFEETVNFIVSDLTEAAALLKPKSEMEMGRATKEAALAIKARILLFAASDLTADGTAANTLVGYASPDRTALWTAARDAAKAVIDMGTCELEDFGAPDQEVVAQKFFEFFKPRDLSSKEVIWGHMYQKSKGIEESLMRNYPNGFGGDGRNGPWMTMVDEFDMKDGSKFSEHFSIDPSTGVYQNISSTFLNENPFRDRDPRLYASILFDSAKWQPRLRADYAVYDPIGYVNTRTTIYKEGGVEISRHNGMDTRNASWNSNNGNYQRLYVKKMMDDEIFPQIDGYSDVIWIFIRYAEVLFMYSEACMELGDIPTATTYLNMIRNRAGLPDFTGDIREALHHEKKVELYFEENRWYDIRRWKILEEAFSTPNTGIDIVELHEDGVVTTTWTAIQAAPPNTYVPSQYWWPIRQTEITKAPQLQQNPGF
ncbi:MAG: RagB/SusD family nutrient uptake outer membrane protein [Bacteroidetes bacterium]|nr:RagB/SusD family nutrient uptake outer membrane protein [Bacteroidota bacterium]